MMKNLITLIALSLFFISFSQHDRTKMREKIKAEKIAFITEKLNLTEAEAVKFWPIYNKHEATRREIKNKYFKPIKKKIRSNADISETEANDLLNDLITGESKIHTAKLNFVNDLKDELPAIKIIKLKSVEDSFNKRLLGRLRKYRSERRKD